MTQTSKDLLEVLMEQHRLNPTRGSHRVDFIALRSEITTALDAGFPVSSVWKLLRDQGKLTMSSDRFRVLCKEAGLAPNKKKLPR